MPDESDKQPEKLEPTTKAPDRIEREQTIITTDQNADLKAALASNPNEFHSMAELPALGPKQPVEAFQIVDEGKTIAASRKVQQQPVLDSFTTGLKAIPETATPQQIAQYQIDYINKKAAESEGGVLPALQGYIEKTNHEYWERAAGSLIGTVQGIGNVAVNLATVADFAAYCIIGDHERSGKMAVKAGESIANTIFAGGQLFEGAYKYLYDVGFEGDYSKPFSDIVGLAIVLNDRWQQLPPREQERRKAELISQLIADGLVGMAGAQSLGKAKTFTELLDGIATKGINKAGQATKKLTETIGRHVDDLLQPEYALPGGGKIKMKDIPRITKDDLFNAMSEWSHTGRTTEESILRKLELYLLDPDHVRGADKAEFFRQALGFTKENSADLAKQIIFDESKATLLEPTKYGDRLQQIIEITGANGRKIDVPFVFIRNPDGVVRLVSVRKLGGRK